MLSADMSTMAVLSEHAHERVSFGVRSGKTLLPVQLSVDANRDGTIDVTGASDQTTQSQPYRFWINNNEDQPTSSILFGTSPDTVPPVASSEDYLSNDIVSTRDLEDWTRLWITMHGLNSAINAGTIKVGLKWVNTTNAPGIKITTASGTDGLDYLTDTTGAAATAQRAQDPNDPNDGTMTMEGDFGRLAIRDANDSHTNITPGAGSSAADFVFPQWVWTNLSETSSTTHFIFEGTSRGQGQLEIVFLKSDGQTLMGQGGSLWLDIRDVKEMYQRAIASGAGPTYSPPTEPYSSNSSTFNASSLGTTVDTNNAFSQPWDETKQCVIFVHGWYTGYYQYIDYSETMFKRLWWQGYKGRFIGYNWPALSGASTYNPSEWNAWIYGTPFMKYVNSIKNQFTPMTVAGHSQGNVVVGSAIEQGLQFDNYIMLQAALPTGCYTTSGTSGNQYNNYGPFVTQEETVPTPNLASSLGYRTYITPNMGNVGSYNCFYNPNDFALHSGLYLWGTLSANWEADQLGYKPDGDPGESGDGAYSFSSITHDGVFTRGGSAQTPRTVTDIRESMSFVARPRSQAAGADSNSPSVFGKGTDLSQSPYNFTGQLSDHSGEFERDYNQVWPLYQKFEGIISPPSQQ
jgi:hypothetical protein